MRDFLFSRSPVPGLNPYFWVEDKSLSNSLTINPAVIHNILAGLMLRHFLSGQTNNPVWIGLRPAHKADIRQVQQVEVIDDLGLAGDRRCNGRAGLARQVTLINREHIDVVAKLLGLEWLSWRL